MASRSVVGLDLSLTSTGIAIGDEQHNITSRHTGMMRLRELRDQVLAYLEPLDDPLVCVEGYSYGSRNSQSHAAGELGGVIRLALFERGITYVDIPPTCRAKLATGKGNAGKDEVISSISARTGIVWTGKGANDRCDAWVLQECGLVHLGRGRVDWPKAHVEALAKIDWPELH